MSWSRRLAELREFVLEIWRYGLGKVGLVLAIAMIAISIAAAITIPPSFASNWFNPAYWADYPQLAPPSWVTWFGIPKAHHQVNVFKGSDIKVLGSSKGFVYLGYRISYTLSAKDFPQNVMVEFEGNVVNLTYYAKNPVTLIINVTRPDGYTVTVYMSDVKLSTINTSPISASPGVTIPSLAPVVAAYTNLSEQQFLSQYSSKLVEGGIYEKFVFGIPVYINGSLVPKPLLGTYVVTVALRFPSPSALQSVLSQPGIPPSQKKML